MTNVEPLNSFEKIGDAAARVVEKIEKGPQMNEIVQRTEAAAPIHHGNMTPMEMLSRAVESGAPMDVLERLMSLQERWEANQARKAFDEAMAAAKAEIPTIVKNRHVDFTGKTGVRTNYRHEDLAEIARTVDPILSRNGLSYRFRATSNINEPIMVTCIISHRLGHSEETTLTAARDDSGNKNSIQGVGSTITYLQRYTLKAALGLAASNDDDARAVSIDDAGGSVSPEQISTLDALLAETGTNPRRFCAYMKVENVSDILASQYQRAVDALNAKKAKAS